LPQGSATDVAVVRVRVEMMGSPKCRIVGKSQPVHIMINPIISTRTRIVAADLECVSDHLEPVQPWAAGTGAGDAAPDGACRRRHWRDPTGFLAAGASDRQRPLCNLVNLPLPAAAAAPSAAPRSSCDVSTRIRARTMMLWCLSAGIGSVARRGGHGAAVVGLPHQIW
jgi:hypothetical protein